MNPAATKDPGKPRHVFAGQCLQKFLMVMHQFHVSGGDTTAGANNEKGDQRVSGRGGGGGGVIETHRGMKASPGHLIGRREGENYADD